MLGNKSTMIPASLGGFGIGLPPATWALLCFLRSRGRGRGRCRRLGRGRFTRRHERIERDTRGLGVLVIRGDARHKIVECFSWRHGVGAPYRSLLIVL